MPWSSARRASPSSSASSGRAEASSSPSRRKARPSGRAGGPSSLPARPRFTLTDGGARFTDLAVVFRRIASIDLPHGTGFHTPVRVARPERTGYISSAEQEAEYLAGVRYRRNKYVTLLQNGRLVRLSYREIDHCCQNFRLVDEWLDAQGRQRRGVVGHAQARLAPAHAIVEMATARLRAHESIFLHAPGVDVECDETRQSLVVAERDETSRGVSGGTIE